MGREQEEEEGRLVGESFLLEAASLGGVELGLCCRKPRREVLDVVEGEGKSLRGG